MTETRSATWLLDQARRPFDHPIHLGLERVVHLLADLGNPQQSLKVIHVAGTNGKGSVLAFLSAILRHAGHRVGLYTSPHLHTLNERIQIAGEAIPDAAMAYHLAEVLALPSGREASFFERMTAVALRHFQTQGLDREGLVLLETGLGGRLDATNVTHPQLSIITAIGMDHTEYLGTTLAAIAQEKAAIFKPAVPAVAVQSSPEVARVLQHHALQTGTPLGMLGRDFILDHPREIRKTTAWPHVRTAPTPHLWKASHPTGWPGMRDTPPPHTTPSVEDDPSTTWRFQEEDDLYTLPLPGLPGRHQRENAALAIAGIRRLKKIGWHVPMEAMRAGLRDVQWPGRLEQRTFRVTPRAPSLAILLDGAHNPDACVALAHFLKTCHHYPGFFVFSTLRDKNADAMAQILAPQAARVWTTQVGETRGREAQALADIWRALDRPAEACATPEAAFISACRACPASGVVVVCGSLYLVGAVRAMLL